MNEAKVVFISDRNKGIAAAVQFVFPESTPAYCCQHIADNIQAKFGNRYRPMFWRIARAKFKKLFYEALKVLEEENKRAAEYVENIPYILWAG
jgi:transposase-like protein